MRRKPGKWIRDELCERLRVAGVPVGSESDSDDLTMIDDTYIRFRINEVQRWGGIGYEVDFGHFNTFKTDRYGNLDFDAIMPALLNHIKEEKACQAKQERLYKLRQRLVDLVEPLGVKMQSPYHGRLGRATLIVRDEEVVVTVQFSIRRPNAIRELIEFLSRKRNVHEQAGQAALRDVP